MRRGELGSDGGVAAAACRSGYAFGTILRPLRQGVELELDGKEVVSPRNSAGDLCAEHQRNADTEDVVDRLHLDELRASWIAATLQLGERKDRTSLKNTIQEDFGIKTTDEEATKERPPFSRSDYRLVLIANCTTPSLQNEIASLGSRQNGSMLRMTIEPSLVCKNYVTNLYPHSRWSRSTRLGRDLSRVSYAS